jgi:hypothetical protein
MRLYALYFLNKKVLVLMIASFFFASAASATVLVKSLSDIIGDVAVLILLVEG